MKKKEQPRRRSLNDRLDAELASAESITVAGINNENPPQSPTTEPPSSMPSQEGGAEESSSPSAAVYDPSLQGRAGDGPLPTKKATTIMPKEVFIALQRYCTDTDTPKHRALYLFIVEGLHRAGQISDIDAQRFRGMAALLTTTYEKK